MDTPTKGQKGIVQVLPLLILAAFAVTITVVVDTLQRQRFDIRGRAGGGKEGQSCSPDNAIECQDDNRKHWCDPRTHTWSGPGDSCQFASNTPTCTISSYSCGPDHKCYAINGGICGSPPNQYCCNQESTLSNCPNSCSTSVTAPPVTQAPIAQNPPDGGTTTIAPIAQNPNSPAPPTPTIINRNRSSCTFWCGGCGGFCGDDGVSSGKTCTQQQEIVCGERPCWELGTCTRCTYPSGSQCGSWGTCTRDGYCVTMSGGKIPVNTPTLPPTPKPTSTSTPIPIPTTPSSGSCKGPEDTSCGPGRYCGLVSYGVYWCLSVTGATKTPTPTIRSSTPTPPPNYIRPTSRITPTPPPTPPTGRIPTVVPLPPSGSRSAAVSEIVGLVELLHANDVRWSVAGVGARVNVADSVRTGNDSRARIDISDGTIVRLAANSVFTLEAPKQENNTWWTKLKLEVGELWVSIVGGPLEIETPEGTVTVRGTVFGVRASRSTGTTVVVEEGKVDFNVVDRDAGDRVLRQLAVTKDQTVTVSKHQVEEIREAPITKKELPIEPKTLQPDEKPTWVIENKQEDVNIRATIEQKRRIIQQMNEGRHVNTISQITPQAVGFVETLLGLGGTIGEKLGITVVIESIFQKLGL